MIIIDLNFIINNTLSKLKEEEYVERIVKVELEKTLKDIIHNCLHDYSDFGKSVKSQIQEQLKINLEKLDIPSYNYMILEAIKSQIDTTIHEEGINRINEQIKDILVTGKDEYRLSELLEELRDEVEGLDELGYERCHEMTLHVEDTNWIIYIYFDPEENVSEYNCKYHLCVDSKTNDIMSIKIREDKYSRSEKDFKEFDTKTIMGGLYGLEQTLFRMYARNSKLIIDEDKCETEVTNPEYN